MPRMKKSNLGVEDSKALQKSRKIAKDRAERGRGVWTNPMYDGLKNNAGSAAIQRTDSTKPIYGALKKGSSKYPTAGRIVEEKYWHKTAKTSSDAFVTPRKPAAKKSTKSKPAIDFGNR